MPRSRGSPHNLAFIAATTIGLTGAIAPLVGDHRALTAVWAIAVAFCASQIAVGVVHWLATIVVHPESLPRLDFTTGVPDAHRTLVAVPTLLTSTGEIDRLVDLLEVRFLANRDRNVGFALVGDFRDAAEEHVAGDEAVVAYAVRAIEALDAKYPDHSGGFYLFHRARTWNPRERAWMGWERKRGKLEDLNNLLRGDPSGFATIAGPVAKIENVAYVLVLDSDTELPRDTAKELAGTLGHPLNRPQFDAARGRVTEGYAILQPRVGITLESAGRTRFSRLHSGEPGIDPYTRAVSDVYQDLFAEGSFIGKGIYDVDAIRHVLGGKLPDNRVLSHDLLEGAYGRAGLASDVIVFEDYPATYVVEASRRTRWIRGDWQIAPWLFRRVPGREPDARLANPVSALSQWKILDNLRRSLVPIALVVLLGLGVALPDAAGIALALVVATFTLPSLLAAAIDAARPPLELDSRLHAWMVVRQLARSLSREAFAVATLPVDASLSIRAIARATVRVVGSREAQAARSGRPPRRRQRTAKSGLGGTYAVLWAAPGRAIALVATVALEQTPAPVLALMLAAAWLIAPAIAWWLGQPIVPAKPQLGEADVAFLRALARRTWRFFDTYVAAADNWLPPDNFQEDPPVGLAHRTSPTNIGLALLANLAAWDFGYLDCAGVIERTRRTFATLDKLARYRGHFYNWYDTTSLEPLRPMYVSTVDSGNLAGHLMTLAAGLEGLAHEPIVRPERLAGLADSFALLGVAAPAALRSRPRTLAAYRDAFTTARAAAASNVQLAAECDAAIGALDALSPSAGGDHIPTLAEIGRGEGPGAEHAAAQIAELRALALHANELGDFDYALLYDRGRHLLAIGYNVADHRLDASFYDLLASEARLASYVAIAQNKLPQEHWFHLGRRLTTTSAKPALLSWSGSMFEYLMPLLVMPAYRGTLLDATYRAAVARQIAYGRDHHVPWGVSESGYNKTDAHLNYQYRAFGVPGLGFKRGLAADLVVAPYASVMALMVAPELACDGELAAARRRRPARRARLLRGRRLHAIAAGTRRDERDRALVHGASPRHELLGARLPARRSADAAAICGRPGTARDRSAVARARATNARRLSASGRGHRDSHVERRRARAPRIFDASDTDARGSPAVERPLSRRGHERRRRLQPMERARDHAVVGRCDARRVRDVLLPARRRRRSRLVGRAPADAQTRIELRGDLLGGACRVSSPRSRHRHARRDRGLCRGRSRAAPDHDREPRLDEARDRAHELRRGRARARCRRRRAPRILELVRRDRATAGSARHPVHAPAAVEGRAHAVARPLHDGEHRADAAVHVRDRSRGVSRPQRHARRTERDANTHARRRKRRGARSDRRGARRIRARARPDHPSSRRDGRRRDARRRARAARQIQHAPARRPRARAGVDAKPSRATPARGLERRRAAVGTARGLRDLLQSCAACAALRDRRESTRASRVVGVQRVRRSADRLGARRRARAYRSRSPARASSRLLAARRSRRRSRDLERGSIGLSPKPAGADRRGDRGARRFRDRGSKGRHLRAPRRSDARGR